MIQYCVYKKRLLLIGTLLFLIMTVSGIYALNEELNQTESGLSTGAVDIELKEYNSNDEPFDEDGKGVLPGEEIILIPRVNNLGIDCYIRTKITYTIDGTLFNELDYIEGNYASWNKDGDYYYYASVLGKGESIDLFNKLVIPNVDFDAYQGKNVIVNIVVDAIQAKNFDGNWEGIEIKKSIDRTYNIDYDGESSVIYEDDTQHHITLDNNYFENLGNLLPGDSESENITISNNSKNDNHYYLAIDYGDLSDEELKLLGKIKLLIKDSKGNILVDSNLKDKSKHSLGYYESGKGDTLSIEISLPLDSDNEYSKLLAKITWKYSYEVINYHEESTPQTGDLHFTLSIAVFLISALGFLIILFLGYRDTDDIEKNNRKKEEIL